MFYPLECLKRGGRFHILWLADSHPEGFKKIARSERRIWAKDTRKLCDQLSEVIQNESGQPTHRFSLRLSSQLLRGLVRLYKEKVNSLFNEMTMTYAIAIKSCNDRNKAETEGQGQKRPIRAPRTASRTTRITGVVQTPQLEELPRVEDMLQNSSNFVARIADITLADPVIPVVVLPPNDNFGEEILDIEFLEQMRRDQTVEMMRGPDTSAQPSGLGHVALDVTDKSHDLLRVGDVEMSRISGQDLTMLRSSLDGRVSATGFEKEVPAIPDVSLRPIPEMPDPQEMQHESQVAAVPIESSVRDADVRESLPLELEELDEMEPRRRRPRKLIIDKSIKITTKELRARKENHLIETRYEICKDAVHVISISSDVFMNRPCHAGIKMRSNIGLPLTRMFMRNLGYIHRDRAAERELEQGVMERPQKRTRSTIARGPEPEESALPTVPPQLEVQDITMQENLPPLEVEGPQEVVNVREQQENMADKLTQILMTYSQEERDRLSSKRVSDEADSNLPKRRRTDESMVLKDISNISRQLRGEPEVAAAGPGPEKQAIDGRDMEIDKQNASVGQQQPNISAREADIRRLSKLLQDAGLDEAYVESPPPVMGRQGAPPQPRARPQSEGSETPLGSLDRTKVSLGDTESTTDSRKFIRDHWGTVPTMVRLVRRIQEKNDDEKITVMTLLENGPVIQECKRIIAAKCFSVILKLIQHGIVSVIKCPDTLQILDIIGGPRLNEM